MEERHKRNILIKIAWQVCLYHIWIERNMRVHNNFSQSAEHIINLVVLYVKYEVYSTSDKCIQCPGFGIN